MDKKDLKSKVNPNTHVHLLILYPQHYSRCSPPLSIPISHLLVILIFLVKIHFIRTQSFTLSLVLRLNGSLPPLFCLPFGKQLRFGETETLCWVVVMHWCYTFSRVCCLLLMDRVFLVMYLWVLGIVFVSIVNDLVMRVSSIISFIWGVVIPDLVS